MIAGVENSQLVFNVVFFVVLTSCLIQGSTIPFMAEKLGLTGPLRSEPPHTLELVSIGQANAEIMEFEVSSTTPISGQKLVDITFPKDVLINAIIRNNDLVTPQGNTKIESGDILYILVSKPSKKELVAMLDSKRPAVSFDTQ